jgi:hypothetical protein
MNSRRTFLTAVGVVGASRLFWPSLSYAFGRRRRHVTNSCECPRYYGTNCSQVCPQVYLGLSNGVYYYQGVCIDCSTIANFSSTTYIPCPQGCTAGASHCVVSTTTYMSRCTTCRVPAHTYGYPVGYSPQQEADFRVAPEQGIYGVPPIRDPDPTGDDSGYINPCASKTDFTHGNKDPGSKHRFWDVYYPKINPTGYAKLYEVTHVVHKDPFKGKIIMLRIGHPYRTNPMSPNMQGCDVYYDQLYPHHVRLLLNVDGVPRLFDVYTQEDDPS